MSLNRENRATHLHTALDSSLCLLGSEIGSYLKKNRIEELQEWSSPYEKVSSFQTSGEAYEKPLLRGMTDGLVDASTKMCNRRPARPEGSYLSHLQATRILNSKCCGLRALICTLASAVASWSRMAGSSSFKRNSTECKGCQASTFNKRLLQDKSLIIRV